MLDPLPLVQDLVLIGGGHSHALVLRMFGMKPVVGVRLTVINPGPAAPYTGMLPGLIAGHYRRDEIMIDLARLARFAGARVIFDRATGIDRAAKVIHLQNRPPLRYNIASVDIGIGSDLPDLPGYAEHGAAAKPLGDYAARWEAFVARALPEPSVVLIGAGVGGVELALASAHRLRKAGAWPKVTLIEQAGTPLQTVGTSARQTLLDEVERAGITLLTGTRPARLEDGAVILTDGRRLPSDFTLSVAGTRPQDWLAQTGLDLHQGFLTVGPTLQTSDPAIFAAGDTIHMPFAPRPKAGVYAVRAAPVLNHNLRAALTGGAMRDFRPQRDYLKLVSLGDRRAVADKFGLRTGGAWLWRVKDRIDRAFMAKFETYPQMARTALPDPEVKGLRQAMGDKPLCAGCGAKVGPGALSGALGAIPALPRADVLSGPGDDAAILTHGTGRQVITTDHLRAFTADPRLMARITAIHALGDIWAMGAAPQAALAQITLPRLSEALQADMLADIMAAAAEVFTEAGAAIVGGHTSLGAELTVGFTVTGLTDHPLTKGGARAGDALILTKPVGTGTILAAEMALAHIPGLILGESLAACLSSMQRPLGPAAAILAPRARAMTDVTGFGLAGHLMEMMRASGTAARIDLAALPLLPGAEVLAAAGHASTIATANRAAVDWDLTAPEGPRAALLFDPQTAGPLLAAVPAAEAQSLIAALHAAGDTAATVIGHVTEGPPHLSAT